MDLLRSGQVCGNLCAVMDAKSIDEKQLLLEAQTLIEFGTASLERNWVRKDAVEVFSHDAQMFEKSNVALQSLATGFPALCAHNGFAFL